jgi:hypothetical protein
LYFKMLLLLFIEEGHNNVVFMINLIDTARFVRSLRR